ncbi:MAG TPA: TolC family protein [Anaeromyxobacteraceae bacterium]
MRSPARAALALLVPVAAAAASAAEPATLSLGDALRELEARSPGALQAASRAREAGALARQAAAALLPLLSATGSWARNSDELVLPRPNPAAPAVSLGLVHIQPREAWGAGASLRVPLAVPGAWADLAAARHAAASAEAGAEAARLQLRLALVQGAWLAAAGEEIAEAASRALAVAREQSEGARRAVDAGLRPPLAALQSEAQAVRRESDLVRARSARDRAVLALGVLLGREGPVRVALPPPDAPAPPDVAALGPAALRARPETRLHEEQVAAAGSQVTSAWLRLLPQLSATGTAFAQDVPLPTGERDGWKVTLDLAWPLYDGGLRYGKRREAEARAAGARAAAEAQRLAIFQEVEDGTRDVAVAAERLRLAERQRAVAADAAATARRAFEAGTTGHVEVLDANDQLFQAEVAQADARSQLGQARAALDRAAGRI